MDMIDQAKFLICKGETVEGYSLLRRAILQLKDERITSDKKDEVDYHLARAHFYFEMDEKALWYINEALDKNSNNVKYLQFKALILLYIGEYYESITILEKSLKLDANNERLYFDLGICYKTIHQREKALHYFQKCIELNPNFDDAYFEIAALTKDPSKARSILEQLLSKNPSHIKALHLIGCLYQVEQKYEEACKYLLRALELSPNTHGHGIREHLVQLYDMANMFEEREKYRKQLHSRLRKDGIVKYICTDCSYKGYKIIGYDYVEVDGLTGLQYEFKLMKGDKAEVIIKLQSPEITNQQLREEGKLGEDEKMFQLAAYHCTYALFSVHKTYRGEPEYKNLKEDIKKLIDDFY